MDVRGKKRLNLGGMRERVEAVWVCGSTGLRWLILVRVCGVVNVRRRGGSCVSRILRGERGGRDESEEIQRGDAKRVRKRPVPGFLPAKLKSQTVKHLDPLLPFSARCPAAPGFSAACRQPATALVLQHSQHSQKIEKKPIR